MIITSKSALLAPSPANAEKIELGLGPLKPWSQMLVMPRAERSRMPITKTPAVEANRARYLQTINAPNSYLGHVYTYNAASEIQREKVGTGSQRLFESCHTLFFGPSTFERLNINCATSTSLL